MNNFNRRFFKPKHQPRPATDLELLNLGSHIISWKYGSKGEYNSQEEMYTDRVIEESAVTIFDNFKGHKLMIVIFPGGEIQSHIFKMLGGGKLKEIKSGFRFF
jgi:hypothetical protein